MSFKWEEGHHDILDFGELERSISEFLDSSTLADNIKAQLAEFDMIQSIFYNPGELTLEDKTVIKELQDFLDGKKEHITPRHLDYTVHIVIEQHKFEILVNLPLEYPMLEPDIYVRCFSYDRNQHSLINTDLSRYISSLARDEACIYSGITWIQDNAIKYFDKTKEKPIRKVTTVKNCDLFTRMWIYSHHIYSKCKRKSLLDLADEYNLTGFCLPGRPGIICFEGLKADNEECWNKVRAMNWKKIVCVKSEEETFESDEAKTIDSLRRFEHFREVSFEGGKIRGRDSRMDFGEFYKYLGEHSCDYIFKILFGVDGKTSLVQST